jgi:hypothetical protein
MTDSIPLLASKLAARGNRSLEAVDEIVDGLAEALPILSEIKEAAEALESARDAYELNDPADATGTEARELARDNRSDAWDEIQGEAERLATEIDNLIEALGLDPMK